MSALSALTSVQLNQGLPSASNSSAANPNSLGRDDFLKILMSQMRNQNPMEPLKDTEFVAQLAQFSQLDGIEKLNSNFSQLLLLQGMSQGTELIGKTVTFTPSAGSASRQGTVDSVQILSGSVQLMIDGSAVALTRVSGIGEVPPSSV